MGRPATGSARWNEGEKVWKALVSLPEGRKAVPMLDDGKSSVAPCLVVPSSPPARCACASCEKARRVAKIISDTYRREGFVPESTAETWNEWHGRYLEVHERLGKLVREMNGMARKWVATRIGTTPMLEVKREQIVAVRDALTRAVLDEEISAKRAMNVWSDIVVAPFKRGFTDDDPRYSSVRVGPAIANPSLGIKPPVTKKELDEGKRDRQPMYPHEFAQLMACAEVPREARRIYALAAYLYCRPQELYALRWTDVDWTAREVRIRRKVDVRTGVEKDGTKSDAGIREIPIHPHLMPMLEAMHGEAAEKTGRLLPLHGSVRVFEHFADQTRGHVTKAGVERTELLVGTRDHMPFDFRSWRTTGCTWLAMMGTDSQVLARQAGHKSPDTTWASYVKRGPDLRQRHGEPFPTLPSELLGSVPVLSRGQNHPLETAANQRRGRDSNPENRRRETLPYVSPEHEKTASVAIGDVVSEATVLHGTRPAESKPIDARTVALAAAVEALSTGHARVLAAELRELLEGACGAAEVVSLASRRTRA